MGSLWALLLTAVVVGFGLGAMSLNRTRRRDTDIDTILAEAERPYFENVP